MSAVRRAEARTGWKPLDNERVLPVLGCVGSAGTTLTALLIASASEARTRVVECGPRANSSLGGASQTEIGVAAGWRRGLRDGLLLERADAATWTPGELLVPTPFPAGDAIDGDHVRTVLDIGWRPGHVLTSGGWLPCIIDGAPGIVLVTPATEPGLRHLETALVDLGHDACMAAVIGPRPRRWPLPLRATAGRLTRQLIDNGRLLTVPIDARTALTGLTDAPFAAALLAAGRELEAAAFPDRTTEGASA